MKTPLKIIIAILFVLAVLLGLSRSDVKLFGGKSSDQKVAESGDQSLESFYQKSQRIETPKTSMATFLAVGDIMLSRNVAGTIAKANDPLLPFRKLDSLLRSTDFNFGNLESPLSGRSDYNPTGSLVFNTPPAYAAGLKEYNFQILNLANNHALDQGVDGLKYTADFLDKAGIFYTGIAPSGEIEEAWGTPVVIANGIKIAFLGASYASVNDGGKATNNYVARIEDVQALQAQMEVVKTQVKPDFIVVTMHAGTEYMRTPNDAQVAFAHAAIDAGADIVIGAHPHWVQTTEQYQGKYIFYSLGNFIFDQMWSQDTREGLALKITLESTKIDNTSTPGAATVDDLQGQRLGAKIKQIELIPVIIDNYSTPRLATDTEKQSILKKIGVTDSTITP